MEKGRYTKEGDRTVSQLEWLEEAGIAQAEPLAASSSLPTSVQLGLSPSHSPQGKELTPDGK